MKRLSACVLILFPLLSHMNNVLGGYSGWNGPGPSYYYAPFSPYQQSNINPYPSFSWDRSGADAPTMQRAYPPGDWREQGDRKNSASIVTTPQEGKKVADAASSDQDAEGGAVALLREARVLLISGTMGRTTQRLKLEKLAQAADAAGLQFNYRFEDEIDLPAMKRLAPEYDVILLDALNGETGVKQLLKKYREAFAAAPRTAVMPFYLAYKKRNVQGIDKDDARQLTAYMENGGAENFERLFRFLSVQVVHADNGETLPPVVIPETGIFHPDAPQKIFAAPDDYLAWYRQKSPSGVQDQTPVIGIAFHREHISAANMKPVLEAIRRVEAAGALPYAFFVPVDWDEGDYRRMVNRDGKPVVDVIVNFQIMILEKEDYRAEIEAIGVPVLHALAYRQGDEQDWRNDTAGIHFSSIPMYLTIPESIGFVDPVVVAALDKKTQELEPIDEQFDSLVTKAVNMARLRHVAPEKKRVAILFYNYPPGVTNLGAAFLNLPESLANTLTAMKTKGYDVEAWDASALTRRMKATLQAFYEEGAVDRIVADGQAVLLPLQDYRRWFDQLPEPVRARISDRWGTPDESRILVEHEGRKAFAIPAIRSGNILLLPQPPRAEGGYDEKSLYHDTGSPPTHSYLATYLYLRDHFKADALVHFGTHGTQEWTPGKDRGLSVFDDPYLIVGDIPVFYPYITNNLAEGMQARRRGRATLISHQTPPFAVTGTFGPLTDIQLLLNEYNGDATEAVREKAKRQLIEKVLAEKLHKDMGWEEARLRSAFDEFAVQLNDYLLSLSSQAQPLGMHSFGALPRREHLISTLALMLGKEYREAAEGKEAATARDFSLFRQSASYRLIDEYVFGDKPLDSLSDKRMKAYLQTAREYLRRFREQAEIENLLAALDGSHVPTSVGGDPVRSPDSLPTGRNLYAFDPSKVPTRAAWETGVQLIEESIADYRQRHGRYPQKFTFNLWSLETMRHLGAMEAQVLWALGVKPVWDKFDRFAGIEVVEASKLGRPRIDVVVSATGLYRDAFPNVMKRIAEAVDQVARMKEENNFAYRHAQALKQSLIEKGVAAEDADRLSTVRIFSNASGEYGNGLKDTTLASETWENEGKLADNFLRNLGYYYGADEQDWGKRLPQADLFAMNLSGTDSVIFSRTSNLYGLLTSDDPFGFFGGLALAVRQIDGKNPEMRIANLRDPDRARNKPVARFMAKELRGRYFHPQWVSAMQEEGYSGTIGVLDVVNNFWGWQVVDPDAVRDDQWQEFVDVYVNDKLELGVKEWFEQHNPQALAQIIERMLEAVRKGYWQADEATVKQLVERYDELRNQYPVASANTKFNEFLEASLTGFGLSPAAKTAREPVSSTAQPEVPPAQPVEGQQLKQVTAESSRPKWQWLLWLMLLLAVSSIGYLRQEGRLPGRWAMS